MANVPIVNYLPDIAQIVRKAPTGTLIRAYVRAARKFCRESRWYRSTLPGMLVANQQLYSLGSDQLMEIVGLKACSCAGINTNTQPWALAVTHDTGNWSPAQNNSTPQWYSYVPEGQVAFYPIPNAAFSVILTLVLQPKIGVTQIPADLLVKWDQVLQAGALGYLLGVPGMPWTDLLESKRQLAAFQAGINNARADEQRGYNAGTVIMRRRPFIVGRNA